MRSKDSVTVKKRKATLRFIEAAQRQATGKPVKARIVQVYCNLDLAERMQAAEDAQALAYGNAVHWTQVAAAAIGTAAQRMIDGTRPADTPLRLMPPVTRRERAAVAAALLYYRENREHFGRPLLDVATSNGQHDPLSDDELTALVHRVTKE